MLLLHSLQFYNLFIMLSTVFQHHKTLFIKLSRLSSLSVVFTFNISLNSFILFPPISFPVYPLKTAFIDQTCVFCKILFHFTFKFQFSECIVRLQKFTPKHYVCVSKRFTCVWVPFVMYLIITSMCLNSYYSNQEFVHHSLCISQILYPCFFQFQIVIICKAE